MFRDFAAVHALSTDVALDMNLQIRFFRDFTTRLPCGTAYQRPFYQHGRNPDSSSSSRKIQQMHLNWQVADALWNGLDQRLNSIPPPPPPTYHNWMLSFTLLLSRPSTHCPRSPLVFISPPPLLLMVLLYYAKSTHAHAITLTLTLIHVALIGYTVPVRGEGWKRLRSSTSDGALDGDVVGTSFGKGTPTGSRPFPTLSFVSCGRTCVWPSRCWTWNSGDRCRTVEWPGCRGARCWEQVRDRTDG